MLARRAGCKTGQGLCFMVAPLGAHGQLLGPNLGWSTFLARPYVLPALPIGFENANDQ